jgi:para-aminobenzoate synthetase / 4-amino-4-deoxychorismate lyase
MAAETTTNQIILYHHTASRWLRFKNPFCIVEVCETADVLPALRYIEEQVRDGGRYAAGFISYEAAGAFDPALCVKASEVFPLLRFGLYPEPEEISLPDLSFRKYSLGDWTISISKSEYFSAISKIKKHIYSGDTYQVNYTLQLRMPFTGDPWYLFLAMVRAQGPGYAVWMDTGRFAICSASPELFFSLEGEKLICKPMKGTVKRGCIRSEDEEYAMWLHSSEKNRAENLMIVDMIRNDLGRIADAGSVKVIKLFEVERHPTLWQMTSTIQANSRKSFTDIMASLFPCASITGAPKIRTTRIITELEKTPRNIYTGCIGFFTPESIAQFNVAIRTAVVDRSKGIAEYGTGGGIVWDSSSGEEYTEALLKARVLTEQRPNFSLLETLLWDPEGGYFLMEYHMKRLADSASYFDYPVNIRDVEKALNSKTSEFLGRPQRLRLLVDGNGLIDIQVSGLSETESSKVLKVKLAMKPVNSKDVFLYHKTTYRNIYDEARMDCPDCDDLILWNEREELTEACIYNIVVDMEGQFFTPPVSSGLLAGVFRAWLLDQGIIRERIIKVSDLEKYSKIFLINSVRKWQNAEIQ